MSEPMSNAYSESFLSLGLGCFRYINFVCTTICSSRLRAFASYLSLRSGSFHNTLEELVDT